MVVGMPRSGTTHLLNLLGADSRLRSTPLWQTYAPVPNPREPMNPDGSDPRYARVAAQWEAQLASNPLSSAMHAREPDHFHEDVELMGPDFAGYNFEWLARAPKFRDYYLSTDQANRDVDEYIESHPRGKYGQLVYNLERDFGIAPADLRKRFDFYYEAFPFLQRP